MGPVPVGLLALFGASVVWAEHRDRLFGDETSVSGSIVVVMAAVVVFSRNSWLFAPMFCASLAGLYWPHLRRAAWSRVALNSASMSLAAAAAAGVFHVSAGMPRSFGVGTLASGVLALAAFWIVNCVVLGIAVGLIRRNRLLAACMELLWADLELLPFAYLGFLAGFVGLTTSVWVGWVLLAGVLASFDLVVVQGWRAASWPRAGSSVLALMAAAGVLAYSATSARLTFNVYGLLAITVGVPAVLIIDRVRPRWSAFGPVTVVAAVALVIGRNALLTVVVVSVCICGPIAARRSSWTVRIALIAAAALAAVLVNSVAEACAAGGPAHLQNALVAGFAATLAGIVGWHLVLLLDLVGEYGWRILRAALDLISDHAVPLVVAGLMSGLVGWLGATAGRVAFALGLLLCWIPVLLSARPWRSKRTPVIDLDEEEVLDVVRSALLDLPASRLPDDRE